VEIAPEADVPGNVQAEWETVEAIQQTSPGQQSTSLTMGMPAVGTYRWRVCAWGVVDEAADPSLVQLPGGCSASRAIEVLAAAATSTTIGSVETRRTVQVPGQVIRNVQERVVDLPAPVQPVTRTPRRTPAPEVAPPTAAEPLPPATFQELVSSSDDTAVRNTAVALPDTLTNARPASVRDGGFSRVVSSGLTTTLPIIPIPFWTLVLMLAAIPIARAWRRSTVGMFDWPEEHEHAHASSMRIPATIAATAVVQHAQLVKNASTASDAPAPAPTTHAARIAPDRGRRAA
jgi:hypothetical protein